MLLAEKNELRSDAGIEKAIAKELFHFLVGRGGPGIE